MGKRQVGDLQPSELVITILISEVAAVPMQSNNIPMIYGLLSIGALVTMEITLSCVSLKSQRARELLSGHPSIVICEGKLRQGELKRMRVTIDDIYEELRLQKVSKLADISYAVLETNGKLSILMKPSSEQPTREDLKIAKIDPGAVRLLIRDGVLDKKTMKDCGIDEANVQQLLNDCSVKLSDVFFCTVDHRGRLWELERKMQT
jgi:uncharacterized membrane protein YcaP (DUF421 family)